MNFRSECGALAMVLALTTVGGPAWSQEAVWPDLSSPPKSIGGGEKDAAVIVGAENYAFVEHVPGAKQNADDWQAYLTEALKVPADRVALLLNDDATIEQIRQAAGEKAAQVEPGGTLWFVFIGHGAPSKDGKDGLLVGVDAQQKAASVYARSFSRNELLSILAKGKQAKTVVLLDACFSGKSPSGQALVAGLQPLVTMRSLPQGIDSRTILMTAAKSDQFAGPLPGGARPAFSYLALGALRGWAANTQGKVTASGLVDYIRRALSLSRDRTQTPELSTPDSAGAVLGTGHEAGPDLAKLQRAAASSSGGGFQVTDLPAVPSAKSPGALDTGGLDLRNLDIEALKRKSDVVKLDKSDAAPEAKAAAWRQLAKDVPQFADKANERAAQWDQFAAQREVVEAARKKRIEARDLDWNKLSELLALDEAVLPETSKVSLSAEFLKAYWKSPGVEPEMAKALVAHVVQESALRKALEQLAKTAKKPDSSTARLDSQDSRILYAIGARLGARIDSTFHLSASELTEVELGLEDAIAGRKPRVPAAEYMTKVEEMARSRAATASPTNGKSSSPEDRDTFYAFGLQLTNGLAPLHLNNSDLTYVESGLKDAVLGRPLQADPKDFSAQIEEFSKERRLAAAISEKNHAKTYLEKAAEEPGAQTSATGLIFIPIKPGTGASPRATDTVKVHYIGTLTDATEFDSSVRRGQPAEFPLDKVIPCWTEGVQKIRVGGKAKLVCPSSIAYGDQGRPPQIPGGATLIFQVELLDITTK